MTFERRQSSLASLIIIHFYLLDFNPTPQLPLVCGVGQRVANVAHLRSLLAAVLLLPSLVNRSSRV